jgi:Kyakuja-Dileera-Zisupton transposase
MPIELNFRHMNVDYAICQALNHNTAGIPQSLIVYDVACQWSINFEKRHGESVTLHLPTGLSWIAAVGKFHLGTHEQTCFAKFSLNFVQGAGQQDGEILETLWAPLNKIGSSIRAMSKSARQETLDDHMRDSNWKKLIKIGAVHLI